MPTIRDVAKAAGVSIGMVSKAFNDYQDVSPKTKKRILEIAKEMNYTPNLVAKNLSSKTQKTIGMITSGFLNSEGKDNSNLFEVFQGVYTAAEETQFELAFYLTDTQKQKQRSYARFCRERNIGGAVLMGMKLDDPYFEELLEAKIPCVLVDMNPKENQNHIGSVSTDNIKASYDIAAYLLEKNHRNIVVVAGANTAYVNHQRLIGVKKAFAAYHVELDEEHILHADFSEHEAYSEVKEYLEENNNSVPTAFLCFSDLMAFGVMKAVKEAGLQIPGDVSVTGFDGLMIDAYTQPPLTTVKQNFYEIGRQSMFLLQYLMEKKDVSPQVTVDYKIIERESVKELLNEYNESTPHK